MFRLVFLKEFKYTIKSLIFWIFTLSICMIYFTQFLPELKSDNLKIKDPTLLNGNNFIEKQSNQLKAYGSKPISSKDKEMSIVYTWLRRDYARKNTLKTKLLLNSNVSLNSEQLKSIEKTLEKMIPNGLEKIKNIDDYNKIKVKIDYEEYLKLIEKIDTELGGNTRYKFKERYLVEARSFEEYEKDINDVIQIEQISNSYARIFCDYLGIGIGIFPIFITSFLLIKDKHKNIYQITYSRKISSFTYVISKLTSIIIAITLIILILTLHATISTKILANQLNLTIDHFAYFKYLIIWILPTLIFVTSISMFISILFNNGLIPILFTTIHWFVSIIDIKGNYSFYKYIIRFNSFGYVSEYNSYFSKILFNRGFYVICSITIICLTILLFNKKRRLAGEHR